jgi:hypothetical protein
MKRSLSPVAAGCLAMTLAACGAQERPQETAEASAEATPSVATTPANSGGAPAYAVVYPGATVEGGVAAEAAAVGPGALLSFTTTDAPERVIDFYKQRAEAAGLAQVSNMSQGDAKAYAASARDGSGAQLQVVAAPLDGQTSVQLTWSAGS